MITNFLILLGVYFSVFWVLVLINKDEKKVNGVEFPEVTILIPVYNEEDSVKKTLDSCLKLSYPNNVRIIVIDDASTDRTPKILEKYLDKIEVIRNKKNLGKAGALNVGLRKVKTMYIAVVDADSTVSRSSLKNAVAEFSKYDNLGAVICKMRPINFSRNFLERLQVIEYLMAGFIRNLTSQLSLLHVTPGVLSVYKINVLKKVGGFDKNNLTEDYEVAVRIRKSGYLIGFSERSLVYTRVPSTFKRFIAQRIRWSRGFIQTHKKHRDVFFNKKYGLFGLYQFPMNVAGPILLYLASITITINIYKKAYEFLYKLVNTPDLINLFDFGSLRTFILKINPFIDFTVSFSLVVFLILLYESIKLYNFNFLKKNFFKMILALIIFIVGYNFIYVYIWFVSFIKELRKEGYDWGTKNES